MEQVVEYAESTLEQTVIRLKSEGKSIREIAEAVGKPPTTVHRLLAKMEQPSADEVESGTVDETLVERPQIDLTLAVARVIDSVNVEELAAVLRRVEEAEDQAANALHEARMMQAEAEAQLEDIATRLAMASDPVTRTQLEEARTKVRADLIEAGARVGVLERQHGEVSSMLHKLQQRQREIREQAVEREIQGLVNGASEKLAATQQAFIAGLREVQETLSQARQKAEQAGMPALAKDLEIRSPLGTVDTIRKAIGQLELGPSQLRGAWAQSRIRLTRYWRGHDAGTVLEVPDRHARNLFEGGYCDLPQAI